MSLKEIQPEKGKIEDIRASIAVVTLNNLNVLRNSDVNTYNALYNIMTAEKSEQCSEHERIE